jgi:hypothetical protein
MRALLRAVSLATVAVVCCQSAAAGPPPPVLGATPTRRSVKLSHYYPSPYWPGKGYGWAGHSAAKWQGYGPLGTGAYRGFGYGFNGYPSPFRAYKFGYPENVLGPRNVGNGYVYHTYFGPGYPGWPYWAGRDGRNW